MISFKPLWKLLIEKKLTKTELRQKANFSSRTLATMGKDQYISMSIIEKICKTLNCKIDDIIEYVDI